MLQKRVVVTGGNGFLGKHIVNRLYGEGYQDVCVPEHKYFDLRRREDVQKMYRLYSPDIVIHAAAVCGGIQACSAAPARFFYDNLSMGMELMDLACDFNVEKFVQIGSVCAYPRDVELPAKESDIWNGYPEETNAPYGVAKRALITMAQAYRQQWDLNAINLLPVNMYGPGDEFRPERSHAIPALIRKSLEAKAAGTDLEVWGRGRASREFIYVEDCADAIVMATKWYDKPEPVNIATGQETTIRQLVEAINEAVGFTGNVVWNVDKPEGQPRRLFDNRAALQFGFSARTPLKEGIRKTVEWYLSKCSSQK